MAETPASFKLGRTRRAFDPRIPHMSAITAGQVLPPPPATVDYWSKLPNSLGMMLNDALANCTCAAFCHALQVWSFHATGQMFTASDADIESLYIRACGYNPNIVGEGPGGNEQKFLHYLFAKGVPASNKMIAYVEIDPRNIDDVKRAIKACGLVYIGFNVPQNIVPPGANPPNVWKVDPASPPIVDGHAVVLPGYTATCANVISWGSSAYTMTWEFFNKYVDEVYAIADSTWINAKGTTPGGLTLQQLEAQMAALKTT